MTDGSEAFCASDFVLPSAVHGGGGPHPLPEQASGGTRVRQETGPGSRQTGFLHRFPGSRMALACRRLVVQKPRGPMPHAPWPRAPYRVSMSGDLVFNNPSRALDWETGLNWCTLQHPLRRAPGWTQCPSTTTTTERPVRGIPVLNRGLGGRQWPAAHRSSPEQKRAPGLDREDSIGSP